MEKISETRQWRMNTKRAKLEKKRKNGKKDVKRPGLSSWVLSSGYSECLSYNRVITQPSVVNTNCFMKAAGRATQSAVKVKGFCCVIACFTAYPYWSIDGAWHTFIRGLFKSPSEELESRENSFSSVLYSLMLRQEMFRRKIASVLWHKHCCTPTGESTDERVWRLCPIWLIFRELGQTEWNAEQKSRRSCSTSSDFMSSITHLKPGVCLTAGVWLNKA